MQEHRPALPRGLERLLELRAVRDDPEAPERAYFTRSAAGLFCGACRMNDSWEMSLESRAIAVEILRKPVAEVAPGPWPKDTAADLRRFLIQRMEETTERRLITAPVLEAS